MVAPVSGLPTAGMTPSSSISQALSSGSSSSQAALSSSQFLQILTSELTNQDPLNPLGSSDFIQQMVDIQNLQQSASLTDSLNSFTQFIQMSAGSSLIGKTVSGLDASGNTVQGVVTSVAIQNGKANLVVGSSQIPVDSVTQIE